MTDTRTVRLLVYSHDGDILTLSCNPAVCSDPLRTANLPGGVVNPTESDTKALDRYLQSDLGVFFQTEEALLVEAVSEYEPGEGLVELALYILKVPTAPRIILSDAYRSFSWRKPSEVEVEQFDVALQPMVRSAIDFHLPKYIDTL